MSVLHPVLEAIPHLDGKILTGAEPGGLLPHSLISAALSAVSLGRRPITAPP